MEKHLVVARYKEDVGWVSQVSIASTVYDKSGHGVHRLPNVGRETHTYLHHIVTHYHDLADYTIFTQGDPFAHCPGFRQAILGENAEFQSFGRRHVSDRYGRPDHPGLPVGQFYERLLGEPVPHYFHFYAGALFGVSRELILCHPLEFYEKCLAICSRAEDPHFVPAPWLFERLWGYVLG